MTRSTATPVNRFSAEVNGGERPLFEAQSITLIRGFRPEPGEYCQVLGTQDIDPVPIGSWKGHLSVYIAKGVVPGKYILGENEKRVWASYAIQRSGNIEAYLSISGEVSLTVVPTPDIKQFTGTLSFTGKYKDREVVVTNGDFSAIDPAKRVSNAVIPR